MGATIEKDRACKRCSYNLKGLKLGDRCPECGTPTGAGQHRRMNSGTITDAPVDYLRALSRGCITMLAALAAFMPSLLWVGWNSVAGRAAGLDAIVAFLAALAWATGAWVITAPRPTALQVGVSREVEWRWLRLINRASQACWPAAVALYATASAVVSNGGSGPALATLAVLVGVALLTGLLGLAPMLVHMSFLADWANDITLAHRLRLAPAGVFIGLVILVVLVLILPMFRSALLGFVLIPLVVGVLLLVLFVGQFVVALIQFVSVAVWAERITTNSLESDSRMSAKIVRRIDEAQSKAAAVRGQSSAQKHRQQGLYFPAAQQPQAYALEPEPPPVRDQSPHP